MIINKKEKHSRMTRYETNYQLTYKQIKSSYNIVKHYLDHVKPLMLQHDIGYLGNLALNPEYSKAIIDSVDHNNFLQENYLEITKKYLDNYDRVVELEKENKLLKEKLEKLEKE